MYPSYLIHFNRQHDKKTGKFTYGDGDGDGVVNDHGHPKDNKNSGDNKNTKSVITTSHKTFKERDVISGKQTTIGSDRYNSIKPRLNRDFTREHTGRLTNVGDRSTLNRSTGNKTFEVRPNRNFTREVTGKTVRLGDTKVGNITKKVSPTKGGNKTSETIGNMNATLSKNFTRTNEKEHLYGPSGYDFNAPPSNGSTKYDAEQRNNSNTLKDADYYLRNNKLTNPIEDGKKLVDSAKDREVDTQKITNREATEIFVMRALGQTLHSLHIDDYDERRAKNKELLEITNTKNWNK